MPMFADAHISSLRYLSQFLWNIIEPGLEPGQERGLSVGKSVGDLRARLGMGTTQTTIFQDGFTSFMGSSVDVDKFFVRFLEKMPKKHRLCFGQICQDMFGISG